MIDIATDSFRPRVRPFTAIGALFRFLKNKEATHEVFRLVSALDGPVTERRFQKFRSTPVGVQVLREKRDLATALKDRAALAALPEGSLGRAYLDFATQEGISPEGFEEEMNATRESFARAGEDRQRFIYRFRHSHDLFHVLTGYGRDFVGELGLLAFTRHHNRSRAFIALIFAGYFKAIREYPGLPIRACIAEGGRLGRASGDMTNIDWEALLKRPLSEVRAQLNIGVPKRYLTIKLGAEAIDRRYRELLTA